MVYLHVVPITFKNICHSIDRDSGKFGGNPAFLDKSIIDQNYLFRVELMELYLKYHYHVGVNSCMCSIDIRYKLCSNENIVCPRIVT